MTAGKATEVILETENFAWGKNVFFSPYYILCSPTLPHMLNPHSPPTPTSPHSHPLPAHTTHYEIHASFFFFFKSWTLLKSLGNSELLVIKKSRKRKQRAKIWEECMQELLLSLLLKKNVSIRELFLEVPLFAHNDTKNKTNTHI